MNPNQNQAQEADSNPQRLPGEPGSVEWMMALVDADIIDGYMFLSSEPAKPATALERALKASADVVIDQEVQR